MRFIQAIYVYLFNLHALLNPLSFGFSANSLNYRNNNGIWVALKSQLSIICRLRSEAERKMKSGSLAQLVEQLTFNQLVAGSNPARPTIFLNSQV